MKDNIPSDLKEEMIEGLREIRNYFMHNDQTPQQHHLFNLVQRFIHALKSEDQPPSSTSVQVEQLAKDNASLHYSEKFNYTHWLSCVESFKAGSLAASPNQNLSYAHAKEIACDFMQENNIPLSGYQSILKMFDLWMSNNNYHKNKLSTHQPKDTSGMQVKALPEVLELDGYINALRHNSPNDSTKILQELFWKAIDAIQSSPLLSTQQGGRRFTLDEVLNIAKDYYSFGVDAAIDLDCGHSPNSPTNKQYFKEKFGINL